MGKARYTSKQNFPTAIFGCQEKILRSLMTVFYFSPFGGKIIYSTDFFFMQTGPKPNTVWHYINSFCIGYIVAKNGISRRLIEQLTTVKCILWTLWINGLRAAARASLEFPRKPFIFAPNWSTEPLTCAIVVCYLSYLLGQVKIRLFILTNDQYQGMITWSGL